MLIKDKFIGLHFQLRLKIFFIKIATSSNVGIGIPIAIFPAYFAVLFSHCEGFRMLLIIIKPLSLFVLDANWDVKGVKNSNVKVAIMSVDITIAVFRKFVLFFVKNVLMKNTNTDIAIRYKKK